MASQFTTLASSSSLPHHHQHVFLNLPLQYQQGSTRFMEKVSCRPVSLPSLRQRIQPETDNAFRPQSVRYGNVQNKLNKLTDQLGHVHLRDIPIHASLPDVRPQTAVVKVVSSSSPRNLSAPSARFSYDGLDLTGVIRSRLLEDRPAPCHQRRDHASAIALKRHIRKLQERKAGKRQRNTHSARYSYDKSLDERKSSRDSRVKPWREVIPKYVKPNIIVPAHNKKAIAAARSRLLEDAWLEERDNEMWAINSMESFNPLTIVLISSQLHYNSPKEVLASLMESEYIVPVVYDFMGDNHSEIIDLIKETLRSYGAGIMAERLVILCQGGSSHISILNKQIMTSVKIRKNNDIKRFWEEVGRMMSKRDYTKTSIILGGSTFANTLAGMELLDDIANAIKPNKVTVQSLPLGKAVTKAEQELVLSLFVSVDNYTSTFQPSLDKGEDE